MTDEAIFLDTSEIIKSNRKAHALNPSKTNISNCFWNCTEAIDLILLLQ
jgi:hypothetical protein